jgi:CheY-like chemotaxis protein
LSGQGAGAGTLLLVHRDGEVRATLARGLQIPGLRLKEADGAVAAAALAGDGAAVVVMKVDLPDVTGRGPIDAVRAALPDVPLVVVVPDADTGRLAAARGATACISSADGNLAQRLREAVLDLRLQALERGLAARAARRDGPQPAPGAGLRLAHDLNNQLQVIIAAAEDLEDAGLTGEAGRSVERIMGAARRAIELARRMREGNDATSGPAPAGETHAGSQDL